MRDNRDDKYEEHHPDEESEYHFSEDEVSYEVEQDTPKPAPTSNIKEDLIKRLKESKRLLIGLVFFLVLIFIVYKFVSPSAPPTENIISQAPISELPKALTANQPVNALPVKAPNPAAAPTVPPVPMSPAVATQPMQSPVSSSTQQTMPIASVQTNQPPVAMSAGQQPSAPLYPTAVANTQTTGAGVEGRIESVAATNEKMMTQLQADYTQKMNDFAAQNAALQNQLQLLNTRVANMEGQLNQLVQALSHQTDRRNNSAPTSQTQPQASPEPKIPYNVQAIIPGRAWLRSDSGETITVAEGDQIKDLGRVSKIDPYDGIVEINTGTKVISLSYGMSN